MAAGATLNRPPSPSPAFPDELPPPARPRPNRVAVWEWLLLAQILLLAGIIRWAWRDFSLDDSFITFTYARSLALGQGFAFAGQKALGTTTPLYALLLALPAAAGLPIVEAAKVLGMLAALASCVLVFLLAREALGGWAGLLAAALLALNARHALISMSGMETGIYTLVCLAALYAYQREAAVAAALFCAAACLLRPDGVLLAVVLTGAHLLQHRRLEWQPALAFLLPVAAWTLYAVLQFGSPIPNSVTAKLAYPEYGSFRLVAAVRTLGAGMIPVFLGLAAVGLAHLFVRARSLLPLAAWTALYVLAFTRAPNFGWYYVPPIPGLVVVMTAGLAAILYVVRARDWRGARWDWLRFTAGLAAAAGLIAGTVLDAKEYRRFMDRIYGSEVTGAYESLAFWLRDHSPPEATVAVPEVGYIGYYSGRKVLDLAGLCSPQVLPYLRAGDYAGMVRVFRPDYVALTTEENRPLHEYIRKSVWFRAHYRPRITFPYRREARYVVYIARAGSR